MGVLRIVGWVVFIGSVSISGTAAGVSAGGLGENVCLSLGMIIALTITPVESLVDAFRGILPKRAND